MKLEQNNKSFLRRIVQMKKLFLPLTILIFGVVSEIILLYWTKLLVLIIIIPIIIIVLLKKLHMKFEINKLNIILAIVLVLAMTTFRGIMIGYRSYKLHMAKKTEKIIKTIEFNTVNEALIKLSPNNKFYLNYDKVENELKENGGYRTSIYDDWILVYPSICILPRMRLILIGEEFGYDKNVDKYIGMSLSDYLKSSSTWSDGLSTWDREEPTINKNTSILIGITLYEILMTFVMCKVLAEKGFLS